MNIISTTSIVKPAPAPDPVFDGHVTRMADHLQACLTDHTKILFTTDASALFETYLNAFPAAMRQHHNCHACRHFVTSFGGLVVVGDDGTTVSPFWQIAASDEYVEPFAALVRKVLSAKVTGVFFHDKVLMGTSQSGGWTHLAATLPGTYSKLHKTTLTPSQAMAEKREDFANVMRTLDEFSADHLAQAVRVLKAEALYRSEHLLGAAEWLVTVQDMRRTKSMKTRQALLWRAVALAPAGFCHPRASMIGALLEDIRFGLPFEDIKARFDAQMHPLRYQRPQAAPAAATIAQAEKIVEQMGIANALKRRFARLDEIEAIWRPAAVDAAPAGAGVFAHLVPKGHGPHTTLELPATVMTWDKFRHAILPDAETIDLLVPHVRAHYVFLTTASDPDAPPILQWDVPEHRNPVAWYVYDGGLLPAGVGLSGGEYRTVTGIALQPTQWGDRPLTHHGESVIFCLHGARDVGNNGGLALFPECMKSELHSVRSVIESHSRSGRLEEPEGPLACGIRLQKGLANYGTFRVTINGQCAAYRLDRWD